MVKERFLLGIFLNRNGDGAGATLTGSSNTVAGSAGDQEVAAGGTLNIGGAGAEMQGKVIYGMLARLYRLLLKVQPNAYVHRQTNVDVGGQVEVRDREL